MGNGRATSPPPSPLYSRPPGNWDHLFTVIVVGAHVYQPVTVNPFVNAFRTSISSKQHLETTHHILPRCCSLELDDKKVRLELYDDNGACCSTGSLRKVLTERDGVAVVYDYTFTNSFELAKKLSKEYAQLRGDATIQKCASLILVGLDGGIGKYRKVKYFTARQFAEEMDIPLVEVDLNSDIRIEVAHMTLVALMMLNSSCI